MSRLRIRNSVYYYRAKLPADIRKLLGRPELTYSLGTADHDSALALSLEMSASQLRLCRVLRHSGRMMTKEQLDQVVNRYMDSCRENHEEDAINYGRVSPEFAQQRRTNITEDLHRAETKLAENDLADVELLARDMLREVGLDVDTESPEFARVCFRLLGARVDMFRKNAQLLLPTLSPQGSLSAPNGRHQEPVETGPKLSELIADYLKHRAASKPMRPKTRDAFVSATELLVGIMGDRPLPSIRNKDAQDFATRMAGLPNRWKQNAEFKGKSAREVSDLTQGQGIPAVKPATVNKDMGLLKTFFTWACKREERPSNPMGAVDPLSTGKARDKKHSFSDDELRLIAPFIEQARAKRPDRYWVATLLAYTGARLEEIAQLRTIDVGTRDDIAYIHILDDAGSVKGGADSSSERRVPIHSQVLARGFLEYVAKRPPDGRLWFDEKKTRSYGGAISKWFNARLDTLNFENRSKKTLHSLRHTMVDRLRAAKVDPLVRREIVGHAHEDVEDQVYGSADGMSLKAKQEALELVKLPI